MASISLFSLLCSIQAPCELVHFYNAPPGMIEEEIMNIIEMEAGVRPQSCKVSLIPST